MKSQNEKPKENTRFTESFYTSKLRNYSSEPGFSTSPSRFIAGPLQEETFLSSEKYPSLGLKDKTRPGILKLSSDSTKPAKYSLSHPNSNSASSSSISPDEPNRGLSRTFREISISDRYDEEATEKPYSILKNNWVGDREYKKHEKKVNFSDNVYQIVDTIKDQMPEIKFTNVRIPDKKGNKFIGLNPENPRRPEQNPYDFKIVQTRTITYNEEPNSKNQEIKYGNSQNSWVCPKCSINISNTQYECNNCRHINWDRFYAIKSSTPKTRSSSIPIKTEMSDTKLHRFQIGNFDPKNDIKTTGRETWNSRRPKNETYTQENFNNNDYVRRTAREYLFNR